MYSYSTEQLVLNFFETNKFHHTGDMPHREENRNHGAKKAGGTDVPPALIREMRFRRIASG